MAHSHIADIHEILSHPRIDDEYAQAEAARQRGYLF